MRASTLLLVTLFIWLAAKGRLNQYWALATTSGASLPKDNATPGSGLAAANSLPGSSNINNPLPDLPQLPEL